MHDLRSRVVTRRFGRPIRMVSPVTATMRGSSRELLELWALSVSISSTTASPLRYLKWNPLDYQQPMTAPRGGFSRSFTLLDAVTGWWGS